MTKTKIQVYDLAAYLEHIGEAPNILDQKEYPGHIAVILNDHRKLIIPKVALIALQTIQETAEKAQETAEGIASAAATVAGLVETILDEVTPPADPPAPTTTNDDVPDGEPAATTTTSGDEQPIAPSTPTRKGKKK